MIGRVGADDFGDKLLQHLVAEGVDTTAVAVDRSTGSGMSAAIVQDDGDYGAVIVSGSNLRIEPETVDEHWRGLRGGRVLVLQNEVPEQVNLAAATVARRDGARVVLNAAPARPMAEELLEKVDVLVVNRVEAEMLSGRPVANREDAFEAARKVRASGRAAIVTLGGLGLVIHGDDEQSTWIPPEVRAGRLHTRRRRLFRRNPGSSNCRGRFAAQGCTIGQHCCRESRRRLTRRPTELTFDDVTHSGLRLDESRGPSGDLSHGDPHFDAPCRVAQRRA